MSSKTGRIQRNSISRDQAFDIYDNLKASIEKLSDDTCKYTNGVDDNKIAEATGVTEASVKNIRIKRFGRTASEMSSSAATAAARGSRLAVLEKKVERLIEWVNKVEGEVNKDKLAEAAAKVDPVLFEEDAA